jgi:hypothetical protein
MPPLAGRRHSLGLVCLGFVPLALSVGVLFFAAGSVADTATIAPTRGLAIGFFDDSAFTGPDAADWLHRAVATSARVVRVGASWSSIAPTRPADPSNPADPAYRWRPLDRELKAVAAAGLRPIIVVSEAPTWAQTQPIPSNASPGAWEPNAADFGHFATAIAARYSGASEDPLHPGRTLPRVRYFEAWDEPNFSLFLAPQWRRVGAAWLPESPILYRTLLNAFYAGVKRAQPGDLVVSGGTGPFGDPPGGQRMAPAEFDRALFCISAKMRPLPCPDPVHFDVLAHHPYAVGSPYTPALNPDDVSIPDMEKLEQPLAVAEKTGRVLPARAKPIWVTEVSYDSDPPDPQAVAMPTFARWTEETLYELWSEGISVITWYLIQDQPPAPSYAATYQSGMYFLNGQPKLAQRAFRFPLVLDRRAAGEPVVWMRVPASGLLRLEGLLHGRWQTVFATSVRRFEVLVGHVPVSAHESFRATVGHDSSLIWPWPH